MVEDNADGLGFTLFSEEIGYNVTDGRNHGCTMDLFIILTLEEEIDILDIIPLI